MRQQHLRALPAVYKPCPRLIRLCQDALQRSSQGLDNAFVGQLISSLIAGVTCVPFDPAPGDLMSAGLHQHVHFLPKVSVLDGLFGRRAPATRFPAMNPLGNALAHIFTVQVQIDLARPFERLQCLNHRHHFHAVIGGLAFATKQLFFNASGFEQNAPPAWAWIALAGPVGINVYRIQVLFSVFRLVWWTLPATETGAATGEAPIVEGRLQARPMNFMPRTRLTATKK